MSDTAAADAPGPAAEPGRDDAMAMIAQGCAILAGLSEDWTEDLNPEQAAILAGLRGTLRADTVPPAPGDQASRLAEVPGVAVSGKEISPEQREALDRLAELWSHYPALRLAQLIGNEHPFEKREGEVDPYYLTDREFVDKIQYLIMAMDEGVTS